MMEMNGVTLVAFLSMLFFLPATNMASILPVGCYSNEPIYDDTMVFAYQQESGLTVAKCSSHCRAKGKAYAGIMGGRGCYCADEFGLTSAINACNFTCADGSCGAVDAYDVYYCIDISFDSQRKLKLTSNAVGFFEARQACIMGNGDVVGRSFQTASVHAEITTLLQGASPMKIWLGLRKRVTSYEWVDEREPSAPNTYANTAYGYLKWWMDGDPGKACVTYDLASKLMASEDCKAPFLAVCSFYNDTKVSGDSDQTLTEEEVKEDASKTLALFIVLPLFFICYGGACILYCIHKILRHCCKKGAYKGHVKLQQKFSSRPPTARKNAVHPFPSAPHPNIPMTFPMTPAEQMKLQLLENALKEARSRRDVEKQAESLYESDSRPHSTRSTGRLLPPMSMQRPPLPPTQAGLSINEILRNKMEQQANKKKPKRIIAA